MATAYAKKDLRFVGFTEAWCDNFISPLLNIKDNQYKCVHILRDPRAIIASRNAGKYLKKYGGKCPLLFLIRHWRRSVAYSILNKGVPGYIFVKYEDVISSPREWFEKICSHIGVPFSERLMHTEAYVDGEGKPWTQNTSFDSATGFSKGSLEKWNDSLTVEEIDFIEYLCKAEMDYCGYRLSKDMHKIKDFASFKENNEEIVEWLRKYNLCVNEHDISLEIVRSYMLKASDFLTDELMDYFFLGKEVYTALANCIQKNLSVEVNYLE